MLDRAERRLTCEGADVPVQGRAFDLLVHLAAHAGTLVRKDDLFAAVWPGVVVTDAALTQAMRVARRALGDDAAAPIYIETVAGHGYRFVASVTALPAQPTHGAAPLPVTVPLPSPPANAAGPADGAPPAAAAVPPAPFRGPSRGAPRGSASGAIAGAAATSLLGGLLYGAALGADGPHPATTLVSVAVFALGTGMTGAAAVAAGATWTSTWRRWAAPLGGLVAGALVGAAGEAAGTSVLATLTGQTPGDLTGGVEGAVIGAALGLAFAPLRRGRHAVLVTAAATMLAFALLAALGRPTFAGSLDAALAFPGDPLRLDVLAPGGLTSGLRVLLAAFEGLLLGLGVGAGARR